ncbi:MAG: transposase [Patescibacteria group bacterium]|jgi:transposase
MPTTLSDELQEKILHLHYSGQYTKKAIAKELGIGPHTVSKYTPAANKTEKIPQTTEHRNGLLKRRGYKNYSQWREEFLLRKGMTRREYEDNLATQIGYLDKNERNQADKDRRSTQERNTIFSTYLHDVTPDYLSQAEIARRSDLSYSSISLYFQGASLPSNGTAQRVLGVIGSPYKSVDDVVENYIPVSLDT